MIIVVCGLPGSGKSTLAKGLARELGYKLVHASGILKELREKGPGEINAEKAEMGTGWWESDEGKEFTKHRLEDMDADKRLDEKLIELINKEDNIVFDSRTLPWLSGKGFNIWVKASEEIRAERIADRDNLSKGEVLGDMKARYESDKTIYKKLYGFGLGEDFSPFQLAIDSGSLSEKQVLEVALRAVRGIKEI